VATKATADHVAIKRALATGDHAVGHPQAAATSTPQTCWLQRSMGHLARSSFQLPQMPKARAAHAPRAFGISIHPHV
jgi:hypothetical protein